MLKRLKMKVLSTVVTMIVLLLLGVVFGLGKPGSRLKEIKPVTVTVEGVEFKVGESKLGDIINGGLLVAPDLKLASGIEGMKLNKMEYKFAYVNKDEYNLGQVSLVNNTKESKNYTDCIISEYKMNYSNLAAGSKKYKYDNVLVDGINFNGMTIDDVKKAMSTKTSEVSDIKQPDGSIAILNYIVNKVRVDISFDYTTKIVSEVEVEVSNVYFE